MIAFLYTCDACGKTGRGTVEGLTLVKLPPPGWKWIFQGPLEGPHACSVECWAKVDRAADGKLYLDWDHESEAGRAPWQLKNQEAMAIQSPPIRDDRPKTKAARKHPLRDKVDDLETRVSSLEVSDLAVARGRAGA